ncbi:MAG TPA: NAD-dependent epimerase/dehydratase family protein [Stellaceae bacterium]|nr:NAD-dependent epimerase/dehydratase family protein [Stellaceae bacterium]
MGLILVTGAGGFIGGHLIRHLVERGLAVRAVDCKPFENWILRSSGAENLVHDLAEKDACYRVMKDVETVYNFAADMGGMGFIENNKAACMLSVLINTHLLMAARDSGTARFLFASSACVYPDYRQADTEVCGLRESDAYPAMPEDGYGWEKLFSERMCRHFREDFGLQTRIARYHNIYGPLAAWDGGREKAPAAIARKVAIAAITGHHEIEIWGDGQQVRSFTFIDDCLRGTELLMQSDFAEPLNIGSDEMVSINQLVDIVEAIAGVKLARRYDLDAPKGVRGRNSDNTLVSRVLGWAPTTPLQRGMETTYAWVYDQVKERAERLAMAAAA